MFVTFVLFTFCLVLSKGAQYIIDVPDCHDEIALIHLKLDKILETLNIDDIKYSPVTNDPKKHKTAPVFTKQKIIYPEKADGKTQGKYAKLSNEDNIEIDKHIKKENEKELNGEKERLKYENKNINGNEKLSTEAYLNNEGFDKGKYHIADQIANQTGSRFERRTRSRRRTNVTLEGDIKTNFREKKGIENHEGSYKGNEFNVGYNLEQQNAKFKDFENNKEINQNTNVNANLKRNIEDGNKYDASKYSKYADESNDEKYRRKEYNKYPDKEYRNNGYNERLYDKYSNKDDKGIYSNNEDTFPRNKNGFEKYDQRFESDVDDDNRNYGEKNNNKGYWKEDFDKERGIGFKQNVKGNEYVNEGVLTKLKASGNNQQADYKGNYKTSDAYKELEDVTNQDLYFYQRGSNIDPSSQNTNSLEIVDEVTFSNVERSGKRDIVHHDGRYKDKAKVNKFNGDEFKKTYDGDEYYADLEDKRDNKKRLIGREKKYKDAEYKYGGNKVKY